MTRTLLLIGCLISMTPAIAAVLASVDSENIDETEVITLVVESTNSDEVRGPDFSVLDKDWDTFGERSDSQIMIRNGQMQSSRSWTIRLRPLGIGTFTIPAFTVGNEKTEEIEVTVRELDPEIREQIENDVFFETKVDTRQQYVQAAIHVTRRLYYAYNVQPHRQMPVPSDIENALVVTVGNPEESVALRDNKTYQVLIQRFVVFAERSGELVIPSSTITARVGLGRSSIAFPVRSDEETVQILPIPDEFPKDQPWFPAESVRVYDSLESSDLTGFRVGDSLVRELEISATNSHSTGIPDIQLKVPDEIRQYPDPPELSDTALVAGILGNRKQTVSLLLAGAGEVEIPDTPLVWWNTVSREVEVTTISGRKFSVDSQPDAVANSSGSESLGGSSEGGGNLGISLLSGDSWLANTFVLSGWGLAIVFALLYFFGMFHSRKRTPKEANELPQLNSRFKSEDPREVKAAMIDWLSEKLNISSTQAIRLLLSDKDTRSLLNRYNEMLYSPDSVTHSIQPVEIRKALKNIVEQQSVNPTSSSLYVRNYDKLGTSSV